MRSILFAATLLLGAALTVPPGAQADDCEGVEACAQVVECTEFVATDGQQTLFFGASQSVQNEAGEPHAAPGWALWGAYVVGAASLDCLGVPGPWEGSHDGEDSREGDGDADTDACVPHC